MAKQIRRNIPAFFIQEACFKAIWRFCSFSRSTGVFMICIVSVVRNDFSEINLFAPKLFKVSCVYFFVNTCKLFLIVLF